MLFHSGSRIMSNIHAEARVQRPEARPKGHSNQSRAPAGVHKFSCGIRENSMKSVRFAAVLEVDLPAISNYFGPASRIAASTLPNFSKFFRNISASLCACSSYFAASGHVPLGFRTSFGTSGHSVGIVRPKIGSTPVFTPRNSPDNTARIIAQIGRAHV